METLVLCPCGHELALHDEQGCRGSRSVRCACDRTREAALEAAVEAARTRPWSPENDPMP